MASPPRDGDGDDLLVGELADLAGTARTNVGYATERRKNVLQAFDRGAIAAGHDGERTGGRAYHAA